jgi:hypothetical protein
MLTAVFAALLAASDLPSEEPHAALEWLGPLLTIACPLGIMVALLIVLIPTFLANSQQRRKNYAYMDAAARHNERTLQLLEEIRGELRTLNERLTRIALGGQQDTVVQPTDVTVHRPGPGKN